MRKYNLLVVLTAIGSALCWWPVIMEPSIDSIPVWLPLAFIALYASLSTILSGGRWLPAFAVSTIATFAGLCSGYVIWYPSDGIEASYLPLVVVVGTLAAVLVSLASSLAVRRLPVSNVVPRGVAWLALVCCAAIGPVVVALTPPLVARRVAANDRLAMERFNSLKNAVERAVAEAGGPGSICDGRSLAQRYSGPPFSGNDWKYIAGNSVKEDGYYFGIEIYCPEPDRYIVEAMPVREKGDGTRRFCAGESGKVGCGVEWNDMRKRNECMPCTK